MWIGSGHLLVQRWLTGLDSLSTIKGRDLDIRRFRGNMDITDRKLPDLEPYRSEVATRHNDKGVVPTGLEDETWLSVGSEVTWT